MIPFFAVCFFNTANSLLRTGYFETGQYVEIIKYRWNNLLITLFLSIVLLSVLVVGMRCKTVRKECVKRLSIVWTGVICLISILLFRAVAKCDSEFLSEAAVQFMEGNYTAFQEGEYLYMYPFQLGYTAFMELIYKMFGVENYIVFQLINMFCIMDIVYVLGEITWDLFEDDNIHKLELYLSMGMVPLFLFSTFVYGDILGWCLGIHAIWNLIRYLKSDNWHYILKSSIWLACGVAVKSNMNILVVAIVIVLLLQVVQKRQAKILLWLLEFVIVSQLYMFLINGIYSWRMGEEIPEGIPKIAWVTMGFQKPYEDGSASGWYNGYNWRVYAANEYDSIRTSQACMTDLKDSLNSFTASPGYAIHYFYDKFTSQWNEPTFMSLLTNEWYSRNEFPQSDIVNFFLYGMGRDILYEFMKAYHFLMFLFVSIGGVMVCKKWKIERAYFVLMLPIAAYGCFGILQVCKQKYEKIILKMY